MATEQQILDFAYTHETSYEVVVAIFEIADDGERVWANPTDVESDAVIKRAFELAPDKTGLNWGCMKITRGYVPSGSRDEIPYVRHLDETGGNTNDR